MSTSQMEQLTKCTDPRIVAILHASPRVSISQGLNFMCPGLYWVCDFLRASDPNAPDISTATMTPCYRTFVLQSAAMAPTSLVDWWYCKCDLPNGFPDKAAAILPIQGIMVTPTRHLPSSYSFQVKWIFCIRHSQWQIKFPEMLRLLADQRQIPSSTMDQTLLNNHFLSSKQLMAWFGLSELDFE